ncbi:MAG: hypothetical protein WKH64_13700, partial [Chloroflexia bacterium]
YFTRLSIAVHISSRKTAGRSESEVSPHGRRHGALLADLAPHLHYLQLEDGIEVSVKVLVTS